MAEARVFGYSASLRQCLKQIHTAQRQPDLAGFFDFAKHVNKTLRIRWNVDNIPRLQDDILSQIALQHEFCEIDLAEFLSAVGNGDLAHQSILSQPSGSGDSLR